MQQKLLLAAMYMRALAQCREPQLAHNLHALQMHVAYIKAAAAKRLSCCAAAAAAESAATWLLMASRSFRAKAAFSASSEGPAAAPEWKCGGFKSSCFYCSRGGYLLLLLLLLLGIGPRCTALPHSQLNIILLPK